MGSGLGVSIAEYLNEGSVWDCLGYLQSSLRDLSSFESLPRTASWAKFAVLRDSFRIGQL